FPCREEWIMHVLRVSMFGKLEIQYDDKSLEGLDYRKAQDLFCFLLLYRNRPHSRETLAGLLWGDCSTSHSKKYLRQALWQLNSALQTPPGASNVGLLVIEPD